MFTVRIEHALRQFALEDLTLAGFLVDATDLVYPERFYPLMLPQDTPFPAVTYTRISTERLWSLDGPSGLPTSRYQFDIFTSRRASQKYDVLLDVADALRNRFDGYSGSMGAFKIRRIELDSERDFFDSETKLWRRSQDYFFTYCESS